MSEAMFNSQWTARWRRYWHCFTTLHRSVTGCDYSGGTTFIGCDCGIVFWVRRDD